jgi:hypothetical protein
VLLSVDHKRGDTFSLVLTHKRAGVATSVTGATLRCMVRGSGAFVATLTATPADQSLYPGRVTVSAAYAATESWPIETLRGDLEVTLAGERYSSPDFLVTVLPDQSRT